MATNFERAKRAIDRLMPVARKLVKDVTVEEMIRTRLSSLSQAYGGSALLRKGRNPVDYTKTTTHIAYLYRCLPAHADWVFKAFRLAGNATSQILSKATVRVACIGGGPGTDIVGLLKFAQGNGAKLPRFKFTILDRERAWNRARAELVATYEGEAEVEETFQMLDLAQGDPWTANWDFVHADIFTFSFALSEVWAFNEQGSVSGFLQRVLDSARSGSIFCYVDNGGDNFTPRIEAEFGERGDFELIGSDEDERMLLSYDEQCCVLEPYKPGFGNQNSKLKGNVALKVWKKI